MKKQLTSQHPHFILILFFLISTISYSQVGIGTTNPNSNALLDVDSSIYTGGILLPRLGLSSTASFAPLSAHVAGMIVYNTATAGDVTPGFYYNNGTLWVRIGGGTATDKWDLLGNSGTTPATNFLGTTDNSALRFRTSNTEAFEISGGNATNRGKLRAMTSGTSALPIYSWNSSTGTGFFLQASNVLGFSTNGTERFRIPNANQVHGGAGGTAALPFYSWSSDPDIGMYRIGTNILGLSTTGTERMRFLANGQVSINNNSPLGTDRFTVTAAATEDAINGYTTTGTGVYGENSSGTGNGIFGNSSNVGIRGYGAHGGVLESGLNAGYGAIAWNTTALGNNRTGLLAVGQNLGLLTFQNTGAILYGTESGGVGFSSLSTGTGLIGVGNAGITAISLAGGSGLAGTGTDIGIFGYASSSANLPNNSIGKAGGYFANAEGGYAYVAAWYDPPAGGDTADINYKIIGTGTVSTIVKDVNNSPITMFAPEAPEILFQDYGVGKLTNGSAYISIDPNFSKNIRVDANHPLKVFVQLEGDCNGVYVTNKTANGFTVKELQNGQSNVSFSWSIVATRADEVFQLKNGEIKVSNNSQRFPTAPSAIELEANQSTHDSGSYRASDTIKKENIKLQEN